MQHGESVVEASNDLGRRECASACRRQFDREGKSIQRTTQLSDCFLPSLVLARLAVQVCSFQEEFDRLFEIKRVQVEHRGARNIQCGLRCEEYPDRRCVFKESLRPRGRIVDEVFTVVENHHGRSDPQPLHECGLPTGNAERRGRRVNDVFKGRRRLEADEPHVSVIDEHSCRGDGERRLADPSRPDDFHEASGLDEFEDLSGLTLASDQVDVEGRKVAPQRC